MFKISQSQTYSWPVKVEIPADGGKHTTFNFDVEFKRISQTRLKEIRDIISTEGMGEAELCRDVVVGWKDVTDDEGEAFPYSAHNRDLLLDIAGVPKGISRAFFESQSGAKAKN